jgi:ubiquinone/menaquinone biosynthesis C-methylase UbiE
MNMLASIKDFLQKNVPFLTEKTVVEAYDIWAGSYDTQPGNLMLDLDEVIFSSLIQDIQFQNKYIADIGCGTGRHWQKLYERSPAVLTGYDVSTGMLKELSKKFPSAIVRLIADNRFNETDTASYDCIILTLTIAHIKNVEEAIASWTRILKNNGDLVITDFHPEILASGGKRSFRHENKSYAVKNYVHPVGYIKQIFENNGFKIIKQEERYIDDSVRSYYENGQAMDVFQKYKGMPVIYGLHLKKQDDSE